MSFWDKLKEEGITGGDGYIRGCMPERYHGAESGSLLREMFMNEDSESYLCYDDEERSEFLFRVMQSLCIGGSMCQPETNMKAYLDNAKAVYKSMVSVRKKSSTNKLYIDSTVISVSVVTKPSGERQGTKSLCKSGRRVRI